MRISKKIVALVILFALLVTLIPALSIATPVTTDPFSLSKSTPVEFKANVDGKNIKMWRYETTYLKPNTSAGQYWANHTIRVMVPETANANSPILFLTNNSGWSSGGHLAAAGLGTAASGATVNINPSGTNEAGVVGTGLLNGYVIVTAQTVARNDDLGIISQGIRMPGVIGSIKAAILFLRYNKSKGTLPAGNPERIVIHGHSGGGGLVAAIGASGNAPDFYPYLHALGAVGISFDNAAAGGRPDPIIPLERRLPAGTTKAAHTMTGPQGSGLQDDRNTYYMHFWDDLDHFSSQFRDDVWAVYTSAMINGPRVADPANSWGWGQARYIGLNRYENMPKGGNNADSDNAAAHTWAIPTNQSPPSLTERGATLGHLANDRWFGKEFGPYLAELGLTWNGAPVTATFDPATLNRGGTFLNYMQQVLVQNLQRAADGLQNNMPTPQSETVMRNWINHADRQIFPWGGLKAGAMAAPDYLNWISFDANGRPNGVNLDAYFYYTWRAAGAGTTQRAAPAFCRWGSQDNFFGDYQQGWGFPNKMAFDLYFTSGDKYTGTPVGAVARTSDANNIAAETNSTAMMSKAVHEFLHNWDNWDDYYADLGGMLSSQRDMLDPFVWIAGSRKGQSTVAPHWLVGYGMHDRDISPIVSILLGLALQNNSNVKTATTHIHWAGPHGNNWWSARDFLQMINDNLSLGPLVTKVSGPDDGTLVTRASADPVFEWSAIDNVKLTAANNVVYSFKLNNNEWSAFTGDTSKTFAKSRLLEGANILSVKARDQAGKEGIVASWAFNYEGATTSVSCTDAITPTKQNFSALSNSSSLP